MLSLEAKSVRRRRREEAFQLCFDGRSSTSCNERGLFRPPSQLAAAWSRESHRKTRVPAHLDCWTEVALHEAPSIWRDVEQSSNAARNHPNSQANPRIRTCTSTDRFSDRRFRRRSRI